MSLAVIFTAKNGSGAAPKNFGVRSGSEVEMDARDLSVFLSRMDKIKALETIQGSSFLAIQAALGVFQRHHPDLAHYKIEVVSERDSVVVIFTDKERPEGTRGSLGVRPGFEVEMSAKDLRVLRSNFIR